LGESAPNFLNDIATINSIEAVPSILQVVCHATGMGFAAVARVTEEALDRLFGARPNRFWSQARR
jgi:hypothetical protein